ncbi:MAG: Holliday junction branch migration protein RuvA [Candidatus Omnitrophica bacterium]|nr:Holliday junction branch migration protein RuvA [Candidatus Omnitrophota bacterium]
MFNYLQGILKVKKLEYIVIDVNGVGYQLSVPLSTFEKLGDLETKVKIFVYLHFSTSGPTSNVKLYGFLTQEEKDLFKSLISISGIGPRIALTILSGSSVKDFQKAVSEENYQVLTVVPGIGRKTAQRLILELKEKIEFSFSKEEKGIERDALAALISLGYKRQAAEQAIKRVLLDKKEINLEELIRETLKLI